MGNPLGGGEGSNDTIVFADLAVESLPAHRLAHGRPQSAQLPEQGQVALGGVEVHRQHSGLVLKGTQPEVIRDI